MRFGLEFTANITDDRSIGKVNAVNAVFLEIVISCDVLRTGKSMKEMFGLESTKMDPSVCFKEGNNARNKDGFLESHNSP